MDGGKSYQHRVPHEYLGDIIGWDIGAANVKAARLSLQREGSPHVKVVSRPFEIWKAKDHLPDVLGEVFAELSAGGLPSAMAITATAELSDAFATKREGVLFVFECIRQCFPDLPKYAWSLSSRFVPLKEVWDRPLDFAAANWLALAQWIAHKFPNALIIDVGSTTTDILPVVDGEVAVSGFNDMARLASGELIYTGALRTNLAAIVQAVPVAGRICRVSSEYFAITADIHLILGHFSELDYSCSTPDGVGPSIESARRRLARLVCADVDMLSSDELNILAQYIYDCQLRQIIDGLNQVLMRLPQLRKHPAVTLGTGAFLGREAGRRAGLDTATPAEQSWNPMKHEVAPCVAAAYLLAESLKAGI